MNELIKQAAEDNISLNENYTQEERTKTELDLLAEHNSEIQEGTYTPQHKVTYIHGFKNGYALGAAKERERNGDGGSI